MYDFLTTHAAVPLAKRKWSWSDRLIVCVLVIACLWSGKPWIKYRWSYKQNTLHGIRQRELLGLPFPDAGPAAVPVSFWKCFDPNISCQLVSKSAFQSEEILLRHAEQLNLFITVFWPTSSWGDCSDLRCTVCFGISKCRSLLIEPNMVMLSPRVQH